jgi:hypothetical protein
MRWVRARPGWCALAYKPQRAPRPTERRRGRAAPRAGPAPDALGRELVLQPGILAAEASGVGVGVGGGGGCGGGSLQGARRRAGRDPRGRARGSAARVAAGVGRGRQGQGAHSRTDLPQGLDPLPPVVNPQLCTGRGGRVTRPPCAARDGRAGSAAIPLRREETCGEASVAERSSATSMAAATSERSRRTALGAGAASCCAAASPAASRCCAGQRPRAESRSYADTRSSLSCVHRRASVRQSSTRCAGARQRAV